MHTIHYTVHSDRYQGYAFSGMHPFIHSTNSVVYYGPSTKAGIGQARMGNSSSPLQFYFIFKFFYKFTYLFFFF